MGFLKRSRMKTSKYLIEYVEEKGIYRLKVEIPKDALRMVRFKNDVYLQYLYLTSLSEMDNESKPVTRFVYYNLNEKQKVLDDVRVEVGEASLDEQRTVRDRILKGLLSIYYLVSKGKIYDVPINPLNFIMENERRIKAFYREDHELGEITDEWLLSFKKLLAYYLVFDTDVIPEKFNEYDIQFFVSKMTNGTQRGYKRFYNCVSIDEMLPLYLTEEEISALTYSYPLNSDFQEPQDLSSGIPLDFDTAIVNATPIITENKDELRKQLVKEKKLDKGKVKRVERKEKNQEKLAKKRKREEERKQKRIDSGYEPNQAKRQANAYNKNYKIKRIKVFPLVVAILLFVFMFLVIYSKITGSPLINLGFILPYSLQETVTGTSPMVSSNSFLNLILHSFIS